MRDRFSKAIGNWYMTSFSIYRLEKVGEAVIAELIDLISMQDIHPDDGLKEIKFTGFYDVCGDLDEGVLDQLIPLSKKLTKITVSGINTAQNKK